MSALTALSVILSSNQGKSGWGLILSLAQQESSLINPSCDSSQFQHLKLRELPINCLPLLGMGQSLKDAAEQGDIEFLYTSIRSDPKVLDNIDQIPFVDTPLHAAAAAGQTLFAMEIMTLKPSFARKLNPDGFTPMHLALQHNQSEVVLRLLYVDKDLVRIQGKGGATPFHCAAETGNVDVLTEFLKACPESITDFTNRRETALHFALGNDKSVAFHKLSAWVRKAESANSFLWIQEWLNWKDGDGKTVREIINSKRENGRAIRRPSFLQKYMIYANNEFSKTTDELRNILLVVATLIVTVTYQAALSPPGGVWQENYNPITDQLNSTGPMNSAISEDPHHAGKVVMSKAFSYAFFFLNSLTFYMTAAITLLLLPAHGLLGYMFSVLLLLLLVCYLISTAIILSVGSMLVSTLYFFILSPLLLLLVAEQFRRTVQQINAVYLDESPSSGRSNAMQLLIRS